MREQSTGKYEVVRLKIIRYASCPRVFAQVVSFATHKSDGHGVRFTANQES